VAETGGVERVDSEQRESETSSHQGISDQRPRRDVHEAGVRIVGNRASGGCG